MKLKLKKKKKDQNPQKSAAALSKGGWVCRLPETMAIWTKKEEEKQLFLGLLSLS